MYKTSVDNDRLRNSTEYPHVFPVSVTHPEFPANYAVYDQLSMPMGCIITPFIATEDRSEAVAETPRLIESGVRIARCTACSAYINAFCEASPLRWFCSLCGGRNVFTRSMVEVDHRKFDIVPSFKVDHREIDGYKEEAGRIVIPSEERPLVHVFLVQESMAIDTMQAVVESLTEAIKALHPDVHIVLLTFSHRIGIHRFSHTSRRPMVQYVHMATQEGRGTIVEGRELAQLHSDQAPMRIKAAMPIAAAVSFRDAAMRVGSCREAALGAVSALFDSFSLSEEDWRHSRAPIPQMMLGPALEAVSDWILEPDGGTMRAEATPPGDLFSLGTASVSGNNVDEFEESPSKARAHAAGGVGSRGGVGAGLSGLIGALQGLSVSLLGGEAEGAEGTEDENENFSPREEGVGVRAGATLAAIDKCSGVILHVFASSPQDLPPRSHDSAPSAVPARLAGISPKSRKGLVSTGGAGWPIGLDRKWVQEMSELFARRSLCVNVWALSSFQGQDVDLAHLSPLALITGGQIHRCVLGTCPKDERARVTEILCRCVTNQLATKCVFRLRLPPVLGLPANGFTGPAHPDPELPGVYRLPACSSTASMGFMLEFKKLGQEQQPGNQSNTVVMQLAFSYDTLVETNNPTTDQSVSLADLGDVSGLESYANTATQASGRERSKTGLLSASTSSKTMLDSVLDVFEMSDVAKERNEWLARRSRDGPAPSSSSSSSSGKAKRRHDDDDPDAALHKAGGRHKRGSSRACAYSQSKKLVAVRRLRVLTIIIECTPKIPRLMQNSHSPTIALLLARQAFRMDSLAGTFAAPATPTSSKKPQPARDGDRKKGSFEDLLGFSTEGTTLLHDWVWAIVGSAVTLLLKSRNPPSSPSLARKAAALDMAVNEALAHPRITRLMQVLFGALNQLAHAHAQVRGGDGGDAATEMMSLLQQVDANTSQRLFYPELIPMGPELVLEQQYLERPLPLRRDAMVMASVGPPESSQSQSHSHAQSRECAVSRPVYAFLLDAGLEVVLYRTIAGLTAKSSKDSKSLADNEQGSVPGSANISRESSLDPLDAPSDEGKLPRPMDMISRQPPPPGERSSSLIGDEVVGGVRGDHEPVEAVFSAKSLAQSGPLFSLNSDSLMSQGVAGIAMSPPSSSSSSSSPPPSGSSRPPRPPTGGSYVRPLNIEIDEPASTPLDPRHIPRPIPARAESDVTKPPRKQSSKTDLTALDPFDASVEFNIGSGSVSGEQGAGSTTSGKPRRRNSRTRSRSNSGSGMGAATGGSSSLKSKQDWRFERSTWLPNDLERRLRVSQALVPRALAAEAGTASAGFLTSHLIEDCSQCNGLSFEDFIATIRRKVVDTLEDW